jgi:UDP-N-acetylmuramyl tripeptide synthase
MGHYFCPRCRTRRPEPDIRVTHVENDTFDRYRITIETATHQQNIVVPLPGLYNIYNALAAATAARALAIDWAPITTGIEQSKPVFGRGERIQAEGRTIRLLLAKNPTGFNEVLRTVFSDNIQQHVLFILNDNIADGRDISWIWDVDFERAVGQVQTVTITGTRTLDLALRLKYAGMSVEQMRIFPMQALRALKGEKRLSVNNPGKQETVEGKDVVSEERNYGLKSALDAAIQQTPAGETLFIIPTYTGLLAVHRELEQRGLTPHYWEGKQA